MRHTRSLLLRFELTLTSYPTNKDVPLVEQLRAAIENILPDGQAVPSSSSSTQSESTSPSAPSVASTVASSPPSPDLFLEKKILLSELSHFIPVGILQRFDGLASSQDPNALVRKSTSSYPEAELSQLEQNNWIRTSICQNAKFPGWSAVRIYALPDDVGRKHVQRSNGTLRGFLKLVMSKLDTSTEAWEGNFDPYAQPDVGAVEDESLFYIFNTLDSPSPDIEKVSDPHARAAMDEVLWKVHDYVGGPDENIGVIGLKTPLYAYQRRSAAYMIQRESEPAQTLDPRLQTLHGPTGKLYYYDKEGYIFREKRLYSEACGGKTLASLNFFNFISCVRACMYKGRTHRKHRHLGGNYGVRQNPDMFGRYTCN